jgi:hypothetical protein
MACADMVAQYSVSVLELREVGMQARTLTPAMIFGYHVRYVVPLFQRPYVWTLADQWQPLWDDVRQVADQALMLPSPALAPPHFLGAIVVDQVPTQSGFIAARNVVDGQQRLTTLQLLLDAACEVAGLHGEAMDASGLRVLVRNDPAIAQHDYEVFKVWPTDRDQPAFRAAMSGSPAGGTPIEDARSYFVTAITSWARTSDPGETAARLSVLTNVLRDNLKAVVIDLEPGDNAQVIFETLNHRGSPLLAADLIKNLIFQTAEVEQRDVDQLYRTHWAELDNTYWRQRVARGRQYVPRIDIFVNYWLAMRLLRDVPTDQIYATFRDDVLNGKSKPDLEQLLAELANDARTFADLDNLPEHSTPGRFRYRILQAMDSAVVTPFLLWIMRWPEHRMPTEQRDKALRAVESWLVRRALCRLTSKETNHLVADLLKALEAQGPEQAGNRTESFLLGQTADSRFWPSDELVIEALKTMPVYKQFLRPRLRMLLEAAEDVTRTKMSEGMPCPLHLTIEHVMPQAWREYWGTDLHDEASRARRDKVVQTLGNLTLVTHRLNPSLSNRPWTGSQAATFGLPAKGKRDELLEHSVLKLNARLVADNPESWTEPAIRERSVQMAESLLTAWPRPKSTASPFTLDEAEKDAEATNEDANAVEDAGVASVGKYQALADWLHAQSAESLPMTFEQVEDILGFQLPMTARTNSPYWHNPATALGRAIVAGAYKATGVILADEKVTFAQATYTGT